jgi:hypothetical protein
VHTNETQAFDPTNAQHYNCDGSTTANLTYINYGLTVSNGPLHWINELNPLSTLGFTAQQLNFDKAFLKPGLLDLILPITINNDASVHAYSTSPDNSTAANVTFGKEVFWIDLVCFGGGSIVGNPATGIVYSQGGDGRNASNLELPINVRFLNPTTIAGTIALEVDYSNGSISPLTKSVSYGLGLLAIPVLADTELFDHFGTVNNGHFTVTVSDSNIINQSLLKKYHWGIANSIPNFTGSSTTFSVPPAVNFTGSSTTFSVPPAVSFTGSSTTFIL